MIAENPYAMATFAAYRPKVLDQGSRNTASSAMGAPSVMLTR